ncbi:MAG: OmpA family protein [Acidobacteriota bacterium]|nr:OmpA family protein [Acidobacteriota bacterium]
MQIKITFVLLLGFTTGCSFQTANTAPTSTSPTSIVQVSPANTPPAISGENSNSSGNQSGTQNNNGQLTASNGSTNASTVSTDATNSSLVSSDGGLKRDVSSIMGKVSDIEGAMRDLNARTVGNEIVVELPSDVLFDFDKYNIRSDAASALEKLLTIIKAQASGGAVRIEGHTDSIATDAYNQVLSERRAASVKQWLVGRRIASERMQTRGFGESRPRASNTKPDGSDDPAGRQQNRRVEIFIAKG